MISINWFMFLLCNGIYLNEAILQPNSSHCGVSLETVKETLTNISTALMKNEADRDQQEIDLRMNSASFRKILCCLLSKQSDKYLHIEDKHISVYCRKLNLENYGMPSTTGMGSSTSTTEMPTTGSESTTMLTGSSNTAETPSGSTGSAMSPESTTEEMTTSTEEMTTTTEEMTTSTTDAPTGSTETYTGSTDETSTAEATSSTGGASSSTGMMTGSGGQTSTMPMSSQPSSPPPGSNMMGFDFLESKGINIMLKNDMEALYNSWSCSQSSTCDPYFISAIWVNRSLLKAPDNNQQFLADLVNVKISKVKEMENITEDVMDISNHLAVKFEGPTESNRTCSLSHMMGKFNMSHCTTTLHWNTTECMCMGMGYQTVVVDMPTTTSPPTESTTTTATSTTMTSTTTATPVPTETGQSVFDVELQLHANYSEVKGNDTDSAFFNLLQDQLEQQLKANDANIERVILQNVNQSNFLISLAIVFKNKDSQNASINNIGAAVKAGSFAITVNGTQVTAKTDVFNSNGVALTDLPTPPPADNDDDEDDDDYHLIIAVVVSIIAVGLIIIIVVVYVTISKKKKLAKTGAKMN